MRGIYLFLSSCILCKKVYLYLEEVRADEGNTLSPNNHQDQHDNNLQTIDNPLSHGMHGFHSSLCK